MQVSIKWTGIFALLAAAAYAAPSADAETYNFNNITANAVANASSGESQLSVDVTSYSLAGGAGGVAQVLFTFNNVGASAMSIADVYFDDGALFSIAFLIDADDNGGDAGVDFTQNASPGNLPGGNSISPAFQTTAGFSADSDPPVQPNGVNPGESLGIVFDLYAGKTFADVISQLDDETVRIGIHVQGFADGGSESFVTGQPPVVPLPPAVWMIGAGLVGIGAFRKRFA